MAYSDDLDVRVTDTSLRDGSHAKRHQFTEDHVRRIVMALDGAGMPVIEVTHGDGLGGSSFNYGFSLTHERSLMKAAVEAADRAKIAALMLPGVGTVDDIAAVHDLGVKVIRIATHCTEADISEQHFGVSRQMGLETVGFLMMSHTVAPEVLATQARIMAEAGCQCVYVVDSAGAMILEQVSDRVAAVVDAVSDISTVGFHGHENLSLSLANTLLAVRAGAVQVDGSTRRFGAGSGNTSCEALAAVCDRMGIRTGLDPLAMINAAEDVVRPVMDEECVLDRMSLIMGYAGVYSSFLKHAYRAAERYGVSGAEILMRCGQRKLVGGQEDQIIDVAVEIANEQGVAT
ncbi:MAG: 4-hydroxy-2-oxovalerate aldolase [Myxococcales bacterium]|nr:4-hydroxy-2-oxovalerate aldolase [Myxococcales bacterium]